MSSAMSISSLELTQAPNVGLRGRDGCRSERFGLPCSNCTLYYSADLTSCPVCRSKERVSPMVSSVRRVVPI